jgi:competence protein ComEC
MQSWMIGTVAAVFAVGWMPALPTPAALLCVFALALPGLVYCRGGWRQLLWGLLCGVLWGIGWGQSLLQQRLPVALEGVLVQVEGRVLEPPQLRHFSHGGQRQRFAFRADAVRCPAVIPSCPRQLHKLLLSYYGDRPIKAGQRWRFSARLKKPWGLANPGSFNYQTWLAQHRYMATGYVRDKDLTLLAEPRWWNSPLQQWRQHIADALQLRFSGRPEAGVLLALSIGDRSGIGASQWAQFQQFGLNHLVVISGLHVGMVAALGFLLGRLFGRSGAHVGAALLALVYSAQAGFALPTVRALVMLFSFQLAAVSRRKARPLRTLLIALTVVALIDPLATHSAGFWLSFSAVALIFYLQAMWRGTRGWRLVLRMQVCLSLSLGLFASFWFGGLGALAPVANLIAVPLLSFWIAPLCLLAALAAPLGQLSPMVLEWAYLFWQLAALPLGSFLQLADQLENSGLSLWLDYQPSITSVGALILALLLLLAHRAVPLRWLALVLLLLPIFPYRQPLAENELRITALDVGQGLAVLVRSHDTVILYDTGAGDPAGPNMASSVILPYLWQLGIDKLDLLVISHADRDHASGVYTLHRQLEIGQTWYGDAPYRKLEGQRACTKGLRLHRGDLEVVALHPLAGQQAEHSSNNRSCVLRLQHRGFVALLPGDVEAEVELQLVRERAELAADLLLVPHHGSRTSSSGPFLRAISPGWAIISRGYGNRFGHPHPRVEARLQRMGVRSLDTGTDGAISVTVSDGKVVGVERRRVTQRYYWH